MRHPFFIIILISFLVSCTSSVRGRATGDVIYKPKYAKYFEILRYGDTTVIITKNPWQGAENIDKRYEFTSAHPTLVCMSSSHTAFLDALGMDSVVVAVSGAKFIYNPLHSIKTDIGFDNNLSIESIASLKPSLMTVYDVTGSGTAQNNKLETLSVPIIYIADFLEQTPLGRAEWVMVFGALTGQLDEAKELFSSIESSYNAKKDECSKTLNKKKVMLNTPYRDVWYAAGDSSYIATLINDAGGDYIVKNMKVGEPISLETAYRLLADADLWLHPSAHIKTRKQLFEENPRFKHITLPIFSNMRRTTDAGGSDFWESAVVRPDIVLADLSKIFANDTTGLYYYSPLY